MSYKFRDTTEAGSPDSLPAEALSINGRYIESEIKGYQTLNVSGREAFVQQAESLEVGKHHGSFLVSRRYPPREIVVTYQLIAETPEDFRAKYNRLNAILNVENAKLIFADEPDKFFTGTPTEVSQVEPGRNSVTGEITFTCNDPFKYSVAEYEVQAKATSDGAMITVDYQGTQPAHPVLEADFYRSNSKNTHEGDCGYVAFANDRGHILQFGDPAETDKIEAVVAEIEEESHKYIDSQQLINEDFKNKTNWTENSEGWTTDSSNHKVAGSCKCAVMGTNGTDEALQINSAGADSSYPNVWHGPTEVQAAGADSSTTPKTQHENWTAYCSLQFASAKDSATANKQRGAVQFYILDSSGSYIAAIQVWKGSKSTAGKARCYIHGTGTVKEWTSVDLSYYNTRFGNKKNTSDAARTRGITIKKAGSVISFNVGGLTYSYTLNASVAAMKAAKMGFYLAKYGSNALPTKMGIYSCSFETNSRERTVIDVPHADILGMVEQQNTFTTNDVLVADCNDASISLMKEGEEESAGVSMLGLGALANEWEEFTLVPGINAIACGYSDWVTSEHAPKFKLRYRKVYA